LHDVYIIKDPSVAKLLADDLRRNILHLLRHREMSVNDLAKELEKSHSSIVHHLNLLLKAGLIVITRNEKVRNLVQPYYKSISKRFHVSYTLSESLVDDPEFSVWQDSYVQRLVEGLEAYNFLIQEEDVEEVKRLLKISYLREKKAYEDRMTERAKSVRIGKHVGRSLAHILSHIQLLNDPEFMEAIQRLSEIIERSKMRG
jgi:DNA-binding transcriptional ArsR family regulator